MKRPLKPKGVYLEEFKRTLAWAFLPTTDWEYWQLAAKSNSGNRVGAA